MADQYDVCVVGSGPGGYVAAIRAAQLDLKTAIIERDKLGGVCLNWGCIPTKALLRTSEIYRLMQEAEQFGLKADNVSYDLDAVVKRSRAVADRLSKGVQFLMKKNKIEVIEGEAALGGPGSLKVKTDGKEKEVKAKNVILATGARPREIEGLEADGETVWDYKHAMVPERFPKRLLVVGSGAIGIEFASFYRSLGAEVTVVEILDRILPVEDKEISAFAAKRLEKQGIKILTGAKVASLDRKKDKAVAAIENGKDTSELEVDAVISAVGIVGNVENLGLEDAGISVEKAHVVVNEWLETGAEGIYAIGDLVGAPWLAHKAMHEGVIAAERIAGQNHVEPLNPLSVPGCTYCHPQIASVGLTEEKAKETGRDLKVGTFPFEGNGKAIALGEDKGLVKTIFDAKTGELLGAHMVGAEVTELIQGFAIARTLETTEAELMETIFPHPTISEAMHESVLAAYGRTLHI